MFDKPIAGRECAECTICCTLLSIDHAELQKPAGVTCSHCDKGCTIHAERPAVCRTFYCAWRLLEIFGPDWRPDLSGVFAQIESDDIPPGFALSHGIGLMLVANPLKTVRQPWFIDFVITGLDGAIPLFLSLPGPPGHQAARLLLNERALEDAAAAGDRGAIKAGLEKALKRLSAHVFRPQVMRHAAEGSGG